MFEQSISNTADNISADEETVTTDLDGTRCAIDDEHTEEQGIRYKKELAQLWQRETRVPTMQV